MQIIKIFVISLLSLYVIGCQATKDLEVCRQELQGTLTENARLSQEAKTLQLDLENARAEVEKARADFETAKATVIQARQEQLSQVKILAEAGLELENRNYDLQAIIDRAEGELSECRQALAEAQAPGPAEDLSTAPDSGS